MTASVSLLDYHRFPLARWICHLLAEKNTCLNKIERVTASDERIFKNLKIFNPFLPLRVGRLIDFRFLLDSYDSSWLYSRIRS